MHHQFVCSLLGGMCAGGYLFSRQSSKVVVVVHVLHVVLVVPVVDREADGSGTMVTGRSITICSWSLQP